MPPVSTASRRSIREPIPSGEGRWILNRRFATASTSQVSAVLEVDFTLALGSVTETVEVTGAAPLLQTEEASVGNVVAAKELERLPVNGRNYTRLMLLMPGTSSVTRSQIAGHRPIGHLAVSRSTAAVRRTTTTRSTASTPTCR